MTARAPAKLNLSLAVLARRPDGFHEIESLLVPVDLADTLTVRAGGPPGIRLSVQFGGLLASDRGQPLARDVPTDATNLVVRAATALASVAGIEPALDIELVKRVPSGAGLGGGSSDAATVLALAAKAWNLGWPTERLADLGATIGSDVPWFFAGTAAIAAGRGERIAPVPPLPPLFGVIACPTEGLSTAAVYRGCTPEPERAGEAGQLARALATGGFESALHLLHNSLEAPARSLCGSIEQLLADLRQAGGLCPRLTGSGSACFTLCRTAAEARAIAVHLARLGDGGRPRWPGVFVVRVGGPGGGQAPA
ncbi:MAG: 4-(cytidine 5'-diphospho)-2-C-methyl-D-erythritol kinase [Planctomycetota bacterium]